MGDKPQPPQLPKDVPADIRDFFECKNATVTLKDGALGWITLPDELKSAVKEGAKPKLTITPGATPGSATIKVSLTTKVGIDASFELPATIKDGQLNVDTSESYLPQGFKNGIGQSVKELNDWFKANGKGFGPPAYGENRVTLSKVDLAAPAQTTTVPTPIPVPGPDIPKPTPPPPPDVPPEPQAAGTDWSHLAPTREQWDKALEDARAEVPPPKPPGVQPPGPKPVVGAGGPGGPKAPVGLGGVAWNYIVLGIVVALLVAAGIYVVGPALGLFGASGPTPTGAASAGATPTLGPSPSPGPTPAPRVVASDDGLVTLTIPNGSAPADANITITALGETDAPPELQEIAFRGSFYRLGPADLVLTGPVTIDRRIDLVALGIDPQVNGYPVVTLALRSAAGTWTWLPDQQLSFIGHAEGAPIEYELHTSATLTSLGDVYGFSSGLRKNIRLEPTGSVFAIGHGFSALVSLDASAASNLPDDEQPRLTSVLPFASQDGVIQFGTPNTTRSAGGVELVAVPVTCAQDATVTVGANGTLSPAVLSSDLLTRLKLGTDVDVGFVTGLDISCKAAGVGASPLTGGCVAVVHRNLGTYPSYLHWVLRFDGEVPSTATLTISYREEGGGILEFDDIPIVRGVATPDTGITRIGAKTIVGMTVHIGSSALDVTRSAVSIFGSFTVTSEQGVLAGNACP